MQTTKRLLMAGLMATALCTATLDWHDVMPGVSTVSAAREAADPGEGGKQPQFKPKAVEKIVAGDDSPGAATQGECRGYNDAIKGLKEQSDKEPGRTAELKQAAAGIRDAAFARGCEYQKGKY
jgi:hypothetical protein